MCHIFWTLGSQTAWWQPALYFDLTYCRVKEKRACPPLQCSLLPILMSFYSKFVSCWLPLHVSNFVLCVMCITTVFLKTFFLCHQLFTSSFFKRIILKNCLFLKLVSTPLCTHSQLPLLLTQWSSSTPPAGGQIHPFEPSGHPLPSTATNPVSEGRREMGERRWETGEGRGRPGDWYSK